MRFRFKSILIVIAMLQISGMAFSQLPVELFSGNKKATLDILFFKYFKNKNGSNSKFLFFNRNRASVDYKMTSTSNLPQLGFTEAISYNHKKLKGFAPVMVVSILNRGVYPKAGIQFATTKKDYVIFSWLVSETLNNPKIDYFFLGRFTPKLTDKLNLFTQVEFVNSLPTDSKNNFTLIQRIRVGLKMKEFQFGMGIDFTESGRDIFTSSVNAGAFLRYEL